MQGGCRAVVMACNISSAVALEDARQTFAVPVFGMVDAGARAATSLGERRVGVLATEGTVRSGAYGHAMQALRPGADVVEVACPRFVPLVETARWDSVDAARAAREYTTPLVQAEVDVVILGCTHYPFLAPAIRAAFPYPVHLVDPAETVCDELMNAFGDSEAETPRHRFEATGDPADFARSGSLLIDRPFTAERCPVWDPAVQASADSRPLVCATATA
jgi:glutamate racemase